MISDHSHHANKCSHRWLFYDVHHKVFNNCIVNKLMVQQHELAYLLSTHICIMMSRVIEVHAVARDLVVLSIDSQISMIHLYINTVEMMNYLPQEHMDTEHKCQTKWIIHYVYIPCHISLYTVSNICWINAGKKSHSIIAWHLWLLQRVVILLNVQFPNTI